MTRATCFCATWMFMGLVGCAGGGDVSSTGSGGSGGSGGHGPGAGGHGPGAGGAHSGGGGGSSDGGGGQGGASSTPASSSATMTTTTGTGGMAAACAGGPTEIDMHSVTLFANPPDLADWPVTTSLTEIDFNDVGVHVDFSKKDGDGRWPDVIPPGWMGPLEYTLGMVECIDGQWYASAVIEFWNGLDSEGGNLAVNNQVAINWYYNGGWGALNGRQPAVGETVGFFVAAGNLRLITNDDGAQSPLMERSNVVLVPFPDANGAQHSF